MSVAVSELSGVATTPRHGVRFCVEPISEDGSRRAFLQRREEEEADARGAAPPSEFHHGVPGGRRLRHVDAAHERCEHAADRHAAVPFLLNGAKLCCCAPVGEAERIMASERNRLEMPHGIPTLDSIEKDRRARSSLAAILEK